MILKWSLTTKLDFRRWGESCGNRAAGAKYEERIMCVDEVESRVRREESLCNGDFLFHCVTPRARSITFNRINPPFPFSSFLYSSNALNAYISFNLRKRAARKYYCVTNIFRGHTLRFIFTPFRILSHHTFIADILNFRDRACFRHTGLIFRSPQLAMANTSPVWQFKEHCIRYSEECGFF